VGIRVPCVARQDAVPARWIADYASNIERFTEETKPHSSQWNLA
jgi:hypothetical protein